MTEGSIHEILALNILGSLFTLFNSPTFRCLAIETCTLILKRRERAQLIFFKLNGEQELFALLDRPNGETIKMVMECIKSLIMVNSNQNADGRPNQENLNRVMKTGMIDIIEKINPYKSRQSDEWASVLARPSKVVNIEDKVEKSRLF